MIYNKIDKDVDNNHGQISKRSKPSLATHLLGQQSRPMIYKELTKMSNKKPAFRKILNN